MAIPSSFAAIHRHRITQFAPNLDIAASVINNQANWLPKCRDKPALPRILGSPKACKLLCCPSRNVRATILDVISIVCVLTFPVSYKSPAVKNKLSSNKYQTEECDWFNRRFNINHSSLFCYNRPTYHIRQSLSENKPLCSRSPRLPGQATRAARAVNLWVEKNPVPPPNRRALDCSVVLAVRSFAPSSRKKI